MLDPDHPIAELLRRDRRFRLDAYVFIFEALRFAQQELGGGLARDAAGTAAGEAGSDEIHHVTGQQLCEAIRRYALQQYGALAVTVLNHWGIRSTGDFGEIVFNLIDIGQMKKNDSDRREDFDEVFDFDEGLREPFEASATETRKERRP
ncbi:MAG: Minf_1886 family protein [Pirellulales bacterium]